MIATYPMSKGELAGMFEKLRASVRTDLLLDFLTRTRLEGFLDTLEEKVLKEGP